MKKQAAIALAAAMLLPGVTLALAKTNPPETIHMTAAQRKIAWNDMKGAAEQKAGSFVPEMGAILPADVSIKPVPKKAASKIPALKPFDFAMVEHQLVIVNPSNKVIAYVFKE